MSAEHTRFICMPLIILKRGAHLPTDSVGSQTHCVQCGLPRPPPECQFPTTSTRTNSLHPTLVGDPEKGINNALVMS